jgi:hypothetical protein
LRVRFNHIEGFGKVSAQDFIYSQPQGFLEPGENPNDALNQGWIPWDGAWYNVRSVRINLSKYKPHDTTRKKARLIDYQYQPFEDKPVYREIYDKYLAHHGFERTISWEQLFTGRMIEYRLMGKTIGYSCIDIYHNALVVKQFVWDYEDPSLSLGKVAQFQECRLAAVMDCDYVYILGGYEKCCLYKADFYGMEWWTGNEWSSDKELYKQLCLRDEQILVEGDDL